MDGARSPEAHNGVFAWIAGLLKHVDLGRRSHILVDETMDAIRRLDHAPTKHVGNWSDGSPRRVWVEPHFSAKKVIGIEETQDQISVGNGGLLATKIVGGRPRIGSCALGTYLQQPQRVNPGNTPAAGPDFQHIDGGE